jgi:hypothetical protein
MLADIFLTDEIILLRQEENALKTSIVLSSINLIFGKIKKVPFLFLNQIFY